MEKFDELYTEATKNTGEFLPSIEIRNDLEARLKALGDLLERQLSFGAFVERERIIKQKAVLDKLTKAVEKAEKDVNKALDGWWK
jgi:hypothetical protein